MAAPSQQRSNEDRDNKSSTRKSETQLKSSQSTQLMHRAESLQDYGNALDSKPVKIDSIEMPAVQKLTS